jgi:nitrogenase-associated protein
MTKVIFYGKRGCQGNARQVQVLRAAGHEVVIRDLLGEPWTEHDLRSYFGAKPAAEWFNRSAVRVKSGEIDPDRLNPDEAMALLLADPALIRRPLIEAVGQRDVGWDPQRIAAWIGLGDAATPVGEGCAAADNTAAERTPPATDCRVAQSRS